MGETKLMFDILMKVWELAAVKLLKVRQGIIVAF